MFFLHRVRFVSAASAAGAAFLLLGAMPARAADPLISAFIGTPTASTKLGYFVLDFNESAAPQSFAFGWHYTGAPSNADYIRALESALGGMPDGFVQSGVNNNFVTRLGYGGQVKQPSAAEPNGYWNLWLGQNGEDWTAAQFGAADVVLSDTPLFTFSSFTNRNELSGAKWHGWRWVSDFTSPTPPAPPRTPFIAVTAAPEPGTLALLTIAALPMVGMVARRRRKAA